MSDTLGKSIKSLRKSYKEWEGIEVVHNKKLYGLLAEAKRIVEQVRADGNESEIDKILKAKKINFSEITTLELKVVKVSLAKDRKRASSYARVLSVAATKNVKSGNLKKWIHKEGGIDKIRLKNTSKSDAGDSFKVGKMSVFSREILLAQFDVPGLKAQKNDIVVLVGRVADNGEIEVVEIAGSGNQDVLVKAAVTAIAKKDAIDVANTPVNQDDDPTVAQFVETADSTDANGDAANV